MLSEDSMEEATSDVVAGPSKSRQSTSRTGGRGKRTNVRAAKNGSQDKEGEPATNFEVQSIQDFREADPEKNTPRMYLVKWVGFSSDDNTWEPEENLQGCEALMEIWNNRENNLANQDETEAEGPADADVGEDDAPESNYEVEKIIKHRQMAKKKGSLEYLVKWKGYPVTQSTWEPESNLTHCGDTLEDYKRTHELGQRTRPSKSRSFLSDNEDDTISSQNSKKTGVSSSKKSSGQAQRPQPRKRVVQPRGKGINGSGNNVSKSVRPVRREPTEEEDAGSVMEQDEDIEELPFDSLVGTLQFITGEKFYQGMYKDDRGGPYEKIIAFPADIMKRSYADSVEDLNGKIKKAAKKEIRALRKRADEDAMVLI